jgi:hypothetical protein
MEQTAIVKIHEPYSLSLRFTADGKQLITAGTDNLIKLCQPPIGLSKQQLWGTLRAPIHSIYPQMKAFSPVDHPITPCGCGPFRWEIYSRNCSTANRPLPLLIQRQTESCWLPGGMAVTSRSGR